MGRTCRGLRTAIRYLHNIPHKLSSPPRNAPRRRRPAAGSARKAKAAARRGCRWFFLLLAAVPPYVYALSYLSVARLWRLNPTGMLPSVVVEVLAYLPI